MNRSITPFYRFFNISCKSATPPQSTPTLPLKINNYIIKNNNNKINSILQQNQRFITKKNIFNRNIINNNSFFKNDKRSYITTTNHLFNQNASSSINQLQDIDNDVKYKSLIDNALEDFKVNNIQASLNTLDMAIKLCENKPDAYLLRADINQEILKNIEHDSFSDYCKALEYSSPKSHVQILFSIAKSSLYKTSDPNTYLSYLEKVFSIDPNNDLSRYILNGFYLRSGEYQAALDNIEKVKQGFYKFLSLGDLALGQKNFDMAIQHYEKAIEICKKEPQGIIDYGNGGSVYHNRFLLFNPDGHHRIIDKDQSTYISPLYHAYHGLGIAFHSLEKLDQAYDCFKTMNELEPTTKFGYKMMAFIQFTLGNFKQALEDIKKAIHLDTFYPSSDTESNILSKIDLNLQLGMYGEAAFELDRLIQISIHFHPWDPEAIEKRAIYFTKLIKIIALVLNNSPITDPNIASRKEIMEIMSTNFPDSPFTEKDLFRETPDEKIHNFIPYLSMYSKIYQIIIEKHAGKMDDQTKFNLECRFVFYNYAVRLLEDSLYLGYPKKEELAPLMVDNQKVLERIYDQEYNEKGQALVRQELHNLMIDLTREIIKTIK